MFDFNVCRAVFIDDVTTDSIMDQYLHHHASSQSDQEAYFKFVLHEVSSGNVSIKTSNFIKQLSRPLPRSLDIETTLFSTNDQVDTFNRTSIIEFPGQLYEFLSEDSCDSKYLHRLLCPKTLWLKIRNLTTSLYNGLQGIVYDINEDGPVIEFQSETVGISKVTFDGTIFVYIYIN